MQRSAGLCRPVLRLRYPASRGLELWLAAAPEQEDEVILMRAGVLVYAVWRTTEAVRRAALPAASRDVTLQRMLEQAAREACRGHARATRMLDAAGSPSVLNLH